MVNDNWRSILSREYVIEVLLYLDQNPDSICGDLSAIIKSGTTRKATVQRMEEAGLIEIHRIERPRLTYCLNLTRVGMDVAGDIRRAVARMDGAEQESEQPNHGSPETEGSEARP